MSTRTQMETSDEFRLLVAEIAEQERCSLLEARQKARALWSEVGGVSADEVAGEPVRDWRFIAWCLALALAVVVAVLVAVIWVVATA